MGPKCPNCEKQLSVKMIEKVWDFKLTAKEIKQLRQKVKAEFLGEKKEKKPKKEKRQKKEKQGKSKKKAD